MFDVLLVFQIANYYLLFLTLYFFCPNITHTPYFYSQYTQYSHHTLNNI